MHYRRCGRHKNLPVICTSLQNVDIKLCSHFANSFTKFFFEVFVGFFLFNLINCFKIISGIHCEHHKFVFCFALLARQSCIAFLYTFPKFFASKIFYNTIFCKYLFFYFFYLCIWNFTLRIGCWCLWRLDLCGLLKKRKSFLQNAATLSTFIFALILLEGKNVVYK